MKKLLIAVSMLALAGCGNEKYRESSLEISGSEILRTCGQKYLASDRTIIWQTFLRKCRDDLETEKFLEKKIGITPTPVQATPVEPPPVVEKWSSGDNEYNDLLPRNTKFQLGDIICLKGHKNKKFVVYDIRPDQDENGNYVSKWYRYQSSRFNNKDEYESKSFYEYTIVKCGDKDDQ